MAELPWSKFFWSDWESDQGLRLCSLAAQGLWMRMLCVCAKHEPKGYLCINGHPLDVDAIARLAGVAETEAENLLLELDRNGVFSRDRKGRIYSRRMVKDDKRSKEGRKHKNRGIREAADNKAENPPPSRGPTRGPSPQRPEARGQIEKTEANASAKKGSRLNGDWELPDDWLSWAVSEGWSEGVVREQAKRFRDYWIAVPGQKGVKLDWEATFRNWIRRSEAKRAGSGSVSQIERYRSMK